MAQIPWLLHVSFASQSVPVAAYVASRQRSRIGAALVLGSLVSVLGNVIGRVLAVTEGNNQIVTYVTSPVTAFFFLLAIREWQLTVRERRVFTILIACFLLTWIILVAFVEDMRDFNVAAGPLFSLVLLSAGAWTLIRRASAVEATPLYAGDWFWVSLGMAVYGACTLVSEPLGGILIARKQYDLFILAWQVRAALSTLGFLCISWGIYLGPSVSKYSTAE